MFDRRGNLSPRQKAVTIGALVLLLPLGIWIGYNLGRWMGTH